MNEIIEKKYYFITTLLRFKRVNVCVFNSDANFNEFVVMHNIVQVNNNQSELKLTELSKRLYISNSAVSQILNSLEKKQYIIRQIDCNDRRRIIIMPTEKGKRYVEQTGALYEEKYQMLLKHFALDELEELLCLLDKLSNVYEKMKKEKGNSL
ncbi:MAG: MarR family winged helix-turn-helix transcriptional regulator [Coprobacillaceae bacterium]